MSLLLSPMIADDAAITSYGLKDEIEEYAQKIRYFYFGIKSILKIKTHGSESQGQESTKRKRKIKPCATTNGDNPS